MPKKNYKLGRDYEDVNGLHGIRALEKLDEKKHYPTFFIEGNEPLDLPHEGTMTIKYKKVARSEREDEDGDTEYSCTIEVHEVVDAYSNEPEAPAKSHSRDTENALDELRAAKRKTKSVDY